MSQDYAQFIPPYPPYDPTDISGFSYETVMKRWPVILTKLIDHVHNTNHSLTVAATDPNWKDRVAEGVQIIERVSKLKYEIARDRKLQEIPQDTGPDVSTYNTELAKLADKNLDTWFTAPWLYAECYLYRLLRSWFASTKYWNQHDPFFPGKDDSFRQSSNAVYKLAAMMHELEGTKSEVETDPDKLETLFNEMIQMCLWGNATDLSLLTNLTHEDILKLQSVGREEQEKRRSFILKDDAHAAFAHLSTLKDSRVDFVLDNAGFEFFTDLIFADFFVTYTPYVSKVIFHPKCLPWFVSDVTLPDVNALLSALHSANIYFLTPPQDSELMNLKNLVQRWDDYFKSGQFSLSVPADSGLGISDPLFDFWTESQPYWEMQLVAPKLYRYLKDSGLVIFKGDLNYRKLTGDVRWPASTPFENAIGPLAGAFPLLSLRTAKADVVVGIDQNRADELDASEEKWRFNGKYALISFVPRS